MWTTLGLIALIVLAALVADRLELRREQRLATPTDHEGGWGDWPEETDAEDEWPEGTTRILCGQAHEHPDEEMHLTPREALNEGPEEHPDYQPEPPKPLGYMEEDWPNG